MKLPGGKFDCIVYEVRGKDGEVSTYYFAKTLPGAPVLVLERGRRQANAHDDAAPAHPGEGLGS